MPLISNLGIFQEMPPKLFPSSFGKVPANPQIEAIIGNACKFT
jgi:hypothetical protein